MTHIIPGRGIPAGGVAHAQYARSSRLASRVPRSGTYASHHESRGLAGRGNPVATLRCVTIPAGDDALEDAAVLLDGFDGSDVVIVTRHEDACQAQLVACNLER